MQPMKPEVGERKRGNERTGVEGAAGIGRQTREQPNGVTASLGQHANLVIASSAPLNSEYATRAPYEHSC